MKSVEAGGEKIEITNPDKILFPEEGYTKTDLVNYYRKIAPIMLPHIENRVLSMKHCPDGVNSEGFYQKRIPDYFPDFIKRFRVKLRQEGELEEVAVVKSEADIVYLANQVVVPHIWLSKIDYINKPDKIIFDIDPSPENDIQDVKFVCRKIKERFEKMGFVVYLMTTGSKGFHVVMPIKPDKDFDFIRDFVHHIAIELANNYPDKMTTELAKNKRRGRVFLDYLRNSYGQTSICPYGVRALPGAPIATPIDWDELSGVKSQSYNISNIFYRLGAKEDPWKNFHKDAKSLGKR